ncbi:MAG: GTPase ObgE [Clostridia bacterium]
MFIDIAKIKIKAGDGGHGKVSFHREKYITNGGPDGGDGGHGGNVVFLVDDNLSTLMDFRYKRKYSAQNGEDGGSRKCSGKNAEDLVIRVPRGTVIREQETGHIIKDMSESEPYICAKGGTGGWGNQHFATPTRQAPRFAKNGLPGKELDITLELKLLADVGLLGFPNVGKSTLLSVVSSAKPKIADYHFTTLVPQLGMVRIDEGESFVITDIPGIIEGAAEGAGLGHDFLRHVDRCRLLLHLVDVSGREGRDPVEDFEIICNEVSQYNHSIATRPQIVVASKVDLVEEDNDNIERLKAAAEAKGYDFMELSSVTNRGVRELMYKTWQNLGDLPELTVFETEYVEPEMTYNPEDITITRDGDVYYVEGNWLFRLLSSVNMENYESRMYFEKQAEDAGIYKKLVEAGIKEGDTVCMYELEFEYVE